MNEINILFQFMTMQHNNKTLLCDINMINTFYSY